MAPTRPALALLLSVTVVLSGCSLPGLGSGDGGSLSPDERPPGVENGTLTDVSALLSAHTTALVRTGFESDFRVNATTVRDGNLFEVARRQQTIVEPGGAEYVYRVTNAGGGPDARFDYWGNGSMVVVRARAGNQTSYRVGEATPHEELTNAQVLRSYLSASTFTVENTTSRDGATYATLTADSLASAGGGLLPRNATNVTDYGATLVVDGDGRIHRLRVTATYAVSADNETREAATLLVDYALVRTNRPDVSRPEWLARALRSNPVTPAPTATATPEPGERVPTTTAGNATTTDDELVATAESGTAA